jgi:hypothetical protein
MDLDFSNCLWTQLDRKLKYDQVFQRSIQQDNKLSENESNFNRDITYH